MADYSISSANLSTLENNLDVIGSNLGRISNDLDNLNSHVNKVDSNVKIVNDELSILTQEFREFVANQLKANSKSNSQQRLIQIRQELEQKFGHYDIVRRSATGILQADDLGIVRKETIANLSDELMISTPNYWLTPNLVALSSWINDNESIANDSVREGIRRNDEKTSLFWLLVCRRFERKSSALKWAQRYLENQDEENLERETIIILDAYSSGLLGVDSENLVSNQINTWIESLSSKAGFIEQQTSQWTDAINLKLPKITLNNYSYLSKYSHSWDSLETIMEGANLHSIILNYFTNIFNQEISIAPLKTQLDEILDSLVNDFDAEEIPLRQEEKYNQLVVDFNGDEVKAKNHMNIQKTVYKEKKDFTQLLTDIAMKNGNADVSIASQKLAIALTKDWIINAYNDIVATNRAKIPYQIEINIDTFDSKTTDGSNENELIEEFKQLVNREKENCLKNLFLNGFDKFCWPAGITIAILGLMLSIESVFLGGICVIGGIGMCINYKSKNKQLEDKRSNIIKQFETKMKEGIQIIRATLAEVVDFRREFNLKDAESQKVIDFLEQIKPEQYVNKLASSTRKINL